MESAKKKREKERKRDTNISNIQSLKRQKLKEIVDSNKVARCQFVTHNQIELANYN